MSLPHPSKDIIGEESWALSGKKIVLGVTSSVSLYRSIDLARTLMKRGAEITVVMSEEATRLISPELFEWATGNRVFHTRFGGEVGHVSLSMQYDAMSIAPATANTIVKLAYGVADSPVTLTALAFLGAKKPILVVPAMHRELFINQPVQDALKRLSEMGVAVHMPKFEGGKAKFPEIWEVAWHIETSVLRGMDMKGLRVLVSAGPTREYIDKVRFISNASSGKMGVSIAMEAMYRGAYVSLVHGPLGYGVQHTIARSRRVITTQEMYNAVLEELRTFDPDLIFLAAAPSDFAPISSFPDKISSDTELEMRLAPTPKIAEAVSKALREKSVLTIFSAEVVDSDEELLEKAIAKKNKYNAHIIVANNVNREDIGFGSPFNQVLIYDGKKVIRSDKMRKEEIARMVIDVALRTLEDMR